MSHTKKCQNRRIPVVDSKFIAKMLMKNDYKKSVQSDLPRWEVYLSFAVWIFNSIYAWYLVYQAAFRYKNVLNTSLFVPGWKLLGSPKKDDANYEWRLYRATLYTTVPCFIVHTIIYRLAERIFASKPETLRSLMFLICTCLLVWIHGFFAVAVATAHGLTMLTATRIFRSTTIVWITACCLLSTLALDWYGNFEDEQMYNLAVFIAYKLLQYISFCWYDLNNSDDDRTHELNFIEASYRMFVYATYLPYSSTLIVPYNEFCKQSRSRSTTHVDPFGIVWLSLRIVFWTVINDFVLHFFFMNSMIIDEHFLNKIDAATLSAVGYVAGQYFHMKYMTIFGVNTVFAFLDGMRPPWPPICISRVAFYSQMWRYFDRGLYNFLRDLLFIPIAYPSFSFVRRFAATLVCFAFVWLWHGTSMAFLCWVSMNFVEVMLENICSEILRRRDVDAFVSKRISPVNRRRLSSVGSIICVVWGIFAIFFFLGGYESGLVFVRRLFFDDWLSFQMCYLIILGYFYGNCCSEIELWYRKRTKKG